MPCVDLLQYLPPEHWLHEPLICPERSGLHSKEPCSVLYNFNSCYSFCVQASWIHLTVHAHTYVKKSGIEAKDTDTNTFFYIASISAGTYVHICMCTSSSSKYFPLSSGVKFLVFSKNVLRNPSPGKETLQFMCSYA